jgi:hypothetical protein
VETSIRVNFSKGKLRLYAFAVGASFGREPGGQSDVLWWEFGQATGVCAIEAGPS